MCFLLEAKFCILHLLLKIRSDDVLLFDVTSYSATYFDCSKTTRKIFSAYTKSGLKFSAEYAALRVAYPRDITHAKLIC